MIKKFEIIKYENQGLEEMPFSAKANPNVVGYKKVKKILMNFIRSGDICLLTGEPGTGKSSLLLWLAKNSKFRNVFHIDASSIEKGFDIKKFLKNSRKGFDKFSDYPKDSIILLDESQDCSPEVQKTLGSLWDHNCIKSIVMAQINPLKKPLKSGKVIKKNTIEIIIGFNVNLNLFELKFIILDWESSASWGFFVFLISLCNFFNSLLILIRASWSVNFLYKSCVNKEIPNDTPINNNS